MITIYDWFGYELPIKERYRLIKKAGFDGVLMWWSEHLNRNDYRNGPQMAREEGLFIENIHTPFQVQDYIWLDNLDGEASIDCYLQCVKDCAEFEIPTMVIHLPDDDKPYNELGLNRITKIAEKAEQLGVNVALENLYNLFNLSFVLEQGFLWLHSIVRYGKVGNASAQLMDTRKMVDQAVEILRSKPDFFLCMDDSCPCCPSRRRLFL